MVLTELTETEQRINDLWLEWATHVHTPVASLLCQDKRQMLTLRSTDLAVLQQVQMNLPYIDDSNGALESLVTLAVHMNTYEGGLACLDLFIGRENWAQRLAEKREEFEGKWKEAWEGIIEFCPITPEQYALDVVIPDNPFSSAPSNGTVPSIRALEP
ncbi:MAG: hypothetical protein JNL76_00220 [Alphaproteobacteria bacterium]|nr:hypothetical protein [Alphaproteobacteria bacterium]